MTITAPVAHTVRTRVCPDCAGRAHLGRDTDGIPVTCPSCRGAGTVSAADYDRLEYLAQGCPLCDHGIGVTCTCPSVGQDACCTPPF